MIKSFYILFTIILLSVFWIHSAVRKIVKGTEKQATKNVQLVLQHCRKTS